MLNVSLSPLLAIALSALAPYAGNSNTDFQCQQLVALHEQYAGVRLTPDQEKLKRVLVKWYFGHCQGRHVASEH